MEVTSPVSIDEYEISDMEPTEGRGKGKVVDEEGPKKYSPHETMWLAKNFIDVSEDPIIGNQQSTKVFWTRVADKYNSGRPKGSGPEGDEQVEWQVDECSLDVAERHSEMDLVEKAREELFSDGKKHFKYFDVLKIVEKSPTYTGGAEPAPRGAPKRNKVSATGHYSSRQRLPLIP